MKRSASVSDAVNRACRAIDEVAGWSRDALEAWAAYDDIGVALVRRMESVDAEATLLRALRDSGRNRNAST